MNHTEMNRRRSLSCVFDIDDDVSAVKEELKKTRFEVEDVDINIDVDVDDVDALCNLLLGEEFGEGEITYKDTEHFMTLDGNDIDGISKTLREKIPATQADADVVDKALAEEVAKMNVTDREKANFDIHGLFQINNKKPDDVEERFAKFENEIQKILAQKKDKASTLTMKHVIEHYPSFVYDRKFRCIFLRSAKFDPKQAAKRIIKHFEVKKEIFGDGAILGRDVKLSDLSKTDLSVLQSGSVQFVPNARDAGGRSIFIIRPTVLNELPEYVTHENVMRAWYYVWMTTLKGEECNKNGIVVINYLVGSTGGKSKLFQEFKKRQNSLPVNIEAIHFCFNNSIIRPMMAAQKMVMPKCQRARLRSHFVKDHEEALFKLQTYGIPVDEVLLPERNKSSTPFLDWLKTRQYQEEKRNLSLSYTIESDNTDVDNTEDEEEENDDNGIVPKMNDVLFGKKKTLKEHPGNQRCMALVQANYKKYEEASKFAKTDIAESIISTIHSQFNGRFIKWNKDESCWDEVERNIARDKIAHNFRHLRRKNLSK
jgi:hypothetical protein